MTTPEQQRPQLDKETALGLALFAAIPIGLVAVVVFALMPDKQEPAPPAAKVESVPPPAAKVWDAPSQGFLSALAAAGITPADDAVAENFVETGHALCSRFAQPEANKEDVATVVRQASNGQFTQSEALAMVDAANSNLCPAAVVPAVAVPVPVVVPNVPNVPSPPRVSSGGDSGGESRFCRKRWWC